MQDDNQKLLRWGYEQITLLGLNPNQHIALQTICYQFTKDTEWDVTTESMVELTGLTGQQLRPALKVLQSFDLIERAQAKAREFAKPFDPSIQ